MMRRRRFPRGPLRPGPGRKGPLSRQSVPPQLAEAHRLFASGEYEKAARLFGELAEKDQGRGLPQAPNLFLRSAEAWLKAGKPEKAREMIKRGLGILIAGGKWSQLKIAGSITADRLKSEGQDGLAGEIQAWLEEQVPDTIKASPAWRTGASAARPGAFKLPAACGQCGGPVNPREIDWYDPSNPVCSYCGAILDTTSEHR